MLKNKKTVLFYIILFIIALSIACFSFSILRVPSNPPETVGNTAGNLLNNGLFCQDEDMVYFVNSNDYNSLYSMNVDETNITKVSDSQVNFLNIGGDYLYFFQTGFSPSGGLGSLISPLGVYRMTTKGKDVTHISKEASSSLLLVNDYLYYQTQNSQQENILYKTTTNLSSTTQVIDQDIKPITYSNGSIYFNGTEVDHALYSLDIETDKIDSVFHGNIWNPIVQGDYVYYMDIDNNYRLSRYSLTENFIEVLTSDRIDTYNVYDDRIYYQKNHSSEPALKRMFLDGSNAEIVAEGNFCNINITSNFVYFNEFNLPYPTYHTPTHGTILVSTFLDSTQ